MLKSDADVRLVLHQVLQGRAPHLEILGPAPPGLFIVPTLLVNLVLLLLLHLASQLPPAEAADSVPQPARVVTCTCRACKQHKQASSAVLPTCSQAGGNWRSRKLC